MDPRRIEELLHAVASGGITAPDAFSRLRDLPYEDLGFAKLDHHRPLRKGYPETIYCAGKTPEQVSLIAGRMKLHGNVLGTRCSDAVIEAVMEAHPEATHHAVARAFTIMNAPPETLDGYVAVVCAGTSDLPVAEEAAVTLESMGNRVVRIADIGVAALQRVLDQVPTLQGANALVVCAGMEGALPSVVAGLTKAPIIGVPTSVGYGASFGGVAALLGMLNSCASGLTVVNIDNGFGAACAAAAINRLANGVTS